MFRIALLLLVGFLISSIVYASDSRLIGGWIADDESHAHIFYENGKYDMVMQDGSLLSKTGAGANLEWQAITEVIPHQIYMIARANGKVEKVPLGIYKFSGSDKLIMRHSQSRSQRMMGYVVGDVEFRIPTDFSGNLTIYTKLKAEKND